MIVGHLLGGEDLQCNSNQRLSEYRLLQTLHFLDLGDEQGFPSP